MDLSELFAGLTPERVAELSDGVDPVEWARMVAGLKKKLVEQLGEKRLIDPRDPRDVLTIHQALDDLMGDPVQARIAFMPAPSPKQEIAAPKPTHGSRTGPLKSRTAPLDIPPRGPREVK